MKNFSIRLPRDQKAGVRRVAGKMGLSEADIVRLCVATHLPVLEKNTRPKVEAKEGAPA